MTLSITRGENDRIKRLRRIADKPGGTLHNRKEIDEGRVICHRHLMGFEREANED
jgi:hypothetical protein